MCNVQCITHNTNGPNVCTQHFLIKLHPGSLLFVNLSMCYTAVE